METTPAPADGLIPPDLLEQVERLAAAEHRPAAAVVREAVERYVGERRATDAAQRAAQPRPKLTPQQAVARILELREGNKLPDGMTIRDMQTFGRS